MAENRSETFSRNARFLAALAPPFLLFVGFFAVVFFVRSRFDGGIGLAAGIIAGASLAFGLTLAYWVLVDWRNLGIIRRAAQSGAVLEDGDVVAFEGVVRVDGEPMTAPFSGEACAAYAYVVSYSRPGPKRRSVRQVLAEGFHMVPTRIEGASESLEVLSFPEFEDDLRESARGTKWGRQARALVDALSGKAPAGDERERRSRLLEARQTEIREVHQDYLPGSLGSNVETLVIEEEILPSAQRVTVIGTYDRRRKALTTRLAVFGANLFIYRGGADEVLARVGGETRGFIRVTAALLGVGGLILGAAVSPAALREKLPFAIPSGAENTVTPDPHTEHRKRVASWIREEFLAGNQGRALELAIDENAYESLPWLFAQGVSPEAPMRARDGWHQLPLVEATRLGYLETVRALLEAGADPNAVEPPRAAGDEPATALGEALRFGHCPIADLLARSGAAYPETLEPNRCR
jgi:hypothetical protein